MVILGATIRGNTKVGFSSGILIEPIRGRNSPGEHWEGSSRRNCPVSHSNYRIEIRRVSVDSLSAVASMLTFLTSKFGLALQLGGKVF